MKFITNFKNWTCILKINENLIDNMKHTPRLVSFLKTVKYHEGSFLLLVLICIHFVEY